jgi:hypothetical protein
MQGRLLLHLLLLLMHSDMCLAACLTLRAMDVPHCACSAMEFAWSSDSNDYAIREGGSRIKIHKNFQEKSSLKIEYAVEGIHGGALVGELPCHVTCCDALSAHCW